MFVLFSMQNVLSFKEEAVLDMRAVSAYDEHSYNLIHCGCPYDVLPVAAIYGANASGKSIFYKGMRQFQDIVIRSFNQSPRTEESVLERCYTPFALEQEPGHSEYTIVLVHGDYAYTYGFTYNAHEIVREWLYADHLLNKNTVTLLERDRQDIRLGPSVQQEFGHYSHQVPKEALVLSLLGKLNSTTKFFAAVYHEIREMLILDADFYESFPMLEKQLPAIMDAHKGDLLEFLAAIDSGIQDIFYRDGTAADFYTTHIGRDGNHYHMNLRQESRGVLKSICIYLAASSLIAQNGVMIVDELDIRLHPLLLKFVVNLFGL